MSSPPTPPPAPVPTAPSPKLPSPVLPPASWIAVDAAATRAIGAAIGRCMPPGALLTLAGGLGAGKTTLVQGLAVGLGIAERVTSPTYTIERSYPLPVADDGAGDAPDPPRPPRLVHVDLYRVGSAAEALELALDERLADGDRVVVEWPSHARGVLPDIDVALTLAFAEEAPVEGDRDDRDKADVDTVADAILADAPRRIVAVAATDVGETMLTTLAVMLTAALVAKSAGTSAAPIDTASDGAVRS
ncbi:MAG: tRNA (adenosine(37)-N6)-threonylcarbamoyltransferase complex ATPase subunit type 1 TsaE [Ardenticatenales bacterium]